LRLSLLLFLLASVATSQVQDADTLLLAAATDRNSSEGILADLLAKGAHVEARNPNTGDTPVILAARAGNLAFVKALLARGADVNAANKTGATALSSAFNGNRANEIVKALLAGGANANARANGGTTVLMAATRLGDTESVLALLAAGADVNAKADDGSTALSAASRSRADIAEILRTAGAEARHPNPVHTDELVELSRLIRRVDPESSGSAAQGPVTFDAVIGRDGAVRSLVLTAGSAALEDPARRAATQWRYEPWTLDGENVEVSTVLTVDFPAGEVGTERDRGAGEIAKQIARLQATNVRRDGMAILEKAIRSCGSAKPPNEACADANDWYGMALHKDTRPETLLKVEPLYLKALELRVRSPHSFASMALSFELEATALGALGQDDRARQMFDRARELRALSVKAMDRAAQNVSSPVQVPAPDPKIIESRAANSVFRVGGGVSPPSVTYKVDPQYSEEARLLKYSGTVLLSVVVDTQGRARDIQLVRGLGLGLDEQAVSAVQRWVFKPGTRGGQPVNVRARIEVNFKLL